MRFGIDEIKSRSKELVSISLPMIVEQVFVTLMGMVSTMLVSEVGEYAVSAVGIVDSISNLIISLFAALTTGGTIVVAQYIGRREVLKAKSAAGQSMTLSLVFGAIIFLIFSILRSQVIAVLFGDADPDVLAAANEFMVIVNYSYPVLAVLQTIFGILRGSGDTRTPMFVSIGMNVINFVLGVMLIAGVHTSFLDIEGLGVRGAAYALLTARVCGLIAAALYLVKRAALVRLNKLTYFKPDFAVQRTILGFGIPTSVESSLFQLGKLLTQIYIVSMSTAAIAANSIGGSIFGFINVPGNAFATGVMILIGQRIGRGKVDDVKRTSVFASYMGAVMLAAICLVFYLLRDPLLSLYGPSEEAYEYLQIILITGFIATPLFWPSAFIMPAALRATGDVKFTMVVSVASMWLFRIVLGYVFGIMMGLGVIGVWIGMYADWIVRGVLFMWRMFSERWMNRAVR